MDARKSWYISHRITSGALVIGPIEGEETDSYVEHVGIISTPYITDFIITQVEPIHLTPS
ncbi:uncharacterized protein PHALS_11999 [Plasmopara halstedii]|uniref:Uncharacterized protein n=1 Tax=Plasmopara halstedii TaxID=4781 RepID=A0A0N7L3E8_PLAHL|nr:uncharacterized protein PHALS_11999 [Plasmopara halstedii]CEG35675.1 hypothetical protein PHALS_11999 [Plasmopara halstedii]|eukprot:XP_024572044.1 hypothetical protein PHALS_11999 [Plasmopara halstedii]